MWGRALMVAGAALLVGCGQVERSKTRGDTAQGDDLLVVQSAIVFQPGLAHPEYDLDAQAPWFTFGKGTVTEINDKRAENYRLVSVSAYNATQFAAALLLNDGVYHRDGDGWSPQLTETELLDMVANDPAKRIVDIAPYQVGNQRYYAAVWIATDASQPINSKVVLHATPDGFTSAMAGFRVIDVEAQPKQDCSLATCTGDPVDFEVSGVAVANVAPNNRTQIFGYGPAVGNGSIAAAAMPANTSTLVNTSVGSAIAYNNARMADYDSPFGDGNYFWIVENTVDTNTVGTTDATCNPSDVSTERNWWLPDLIFADDHNREDAVVSNSRRFGARVGKIKPYKATADGGNDRWLITYYDNTIPPTTGTSNGGIPVLQKLDAVVYNRMKRWGEAAVTLGIVKDGNLVYSKGYGHSELGSLRQTQPTDMFRLASVSKPILQSLILRLVEQAPTINGKTFSLALKVFGDILPYSKPGTPTSLCPSQTVTGNCQIDTPIWAPGSPPDASGCTLGDIRVSDLLWHASGLLITDDSTTDNDAFTFNDDIGSASTPGRWTQKECDARAAGQLPFFLPPGSRAKYTNTEFQILTAVIEQVTGMQYEVYLASVLAPLGLNRIAPARPSSEADPPGLVQAVPYSFPFPLFFYGGAIPVWPNADSVTCPSPLSPSCTNHLFVGSGSMAASHVDLLRWATAIDGSRGGTSIISKTTFDNNMRVFLLDGAGNLVPAGKTFNHGGYFPTDTETFLNMRADGISYFVGANTDSLFAGEDPQFCCPGTPPVACGATQAAVNCGTDGSGNPILATKRVRYTHALPANGSFLGEIINDIETILGNCGAQLPTDDHFGDTLPNEPSARCHDVTVSAGASCTANVTAAAVDAGSTGGTPTLSPSGPYGLGPHDVTLQVANGTSVSTCKAKIQVNDTTPPTITAPANVNVTTCDGGAVTLGTPMAADNCASPPSIQTTIIAANGTPITPIVVTGGTATLGPGSYTVQYRANDGVSSSAPVTQTVTIRAAVQASQSFTLADRAVLRQPGGAPAALFNSGTGATLIGYDARAGGVVSWAAVTALDRATIAGNIVSASSISATNADVSGVELPFTVLPPMSGLPSLPAFPTPTLQDITVNTGTVTIGPGSRANGTVNGGTLVLQAGTYYFRSLTINSNVTVRASAGTSIYVRDQLAFRSSIRQPAGTAVQSVVLGFGGANTTIEAVFNGSFVAPNANVFFGAGSGVTFTGAFYARTIEVRPASTLVCQTSAALPPS